MLYSCFRLLVNVWTWHNLTNDITENTMSMLSFPNWVICPSFNPILRNSKILPKLNICHKPQRGFSPKSLQQFAYANLFKFNIPQMCQSINSLKEVRSVSPCECECPRHINTPAQANSGDKKIHRTDQNNVCGRCVLTSGSLSPLFLSLSLSIHSATLTIRC